MNDIQSAKSSYSVVVLISATTEWESIKKLFPQKSYSQSPYGEWFEITFSGIPVDDPILFFQSGWGKIAAAGATQYIIDQWHPRLLIVLGTCGGFEGVAQTGSHILAEKTVVYDIIEQIADPVEAITHYMTELDISWLSEPFPLPVTRGTLVSADRDLVADQIPYLKSTYAAKAGDWESGAIAYIASKNALPCVIIKGVSDLVGISGGEAYGLLELYKVRTQEIMKQLIGSLPSLIKSAEKLFG